MYYMQFAVSHPQLSKNKTVSTVLQHCFTVNATAVAETTALVPKSPYPYPLCPPEVARIRCARGGCSLRMKRSIRSLQTTADYCQRNLRGQGHSHQPCWQSFSNNLDHEGEKEGPKTPFVPSS